MTDPVTINIAGIAAAAIGKSGIVATIQDAAVNFLTEQAKTLGKDELSDRIMGLRSDRKLRQEIQAVSERAGRRWADEYFDRDLTLVLARDTQFVDLPSVREAIVTVAKRPFDRIASETLAAKFSDVLPQKFDNARVERGIVAFLEILREELAGIADLRDALRTVSGIQTARSTEQTSVATQESAVALEAILHRMEHGPTPTDETLKRYLNWVIDQHRYLDPRGTMQTVRQVQVLLEEVYVSLQAEAEPQLGEHDRRLFERELDELMKREDLRTEEREDLRENLLANYARNEERETRAPAELAGLVCEKNKLVILGDPGAGKTTLMRYLALRHAEAMKRGEPFMSDLGETRLPLYLRLANYAEHHGGRSLMDYLPTCIRGEADGDPALTVLIRERLAQGKCLVLLDGLDEVIEPNERAQIAAQADALIRMHEEAGNRFLVTSRKPGYRTAPLAGDIPHYSVREMNDEQIKRFLDCWCHAVERFQRPDLSPEAQNIKAQGEIDGITQAIESNPGVRRLAANPLLLRTLALIHRTGARLPQRRIELYRLAADTLIRDWELARGIPQAALVNEAEANRLLAELAAWMHEEKPAGIATEGEVRALLANVKAAFAGKEPDDPEVQNAVGEFLLKIRQHTGLFVERAPRRYGFMHLTFEEYFTARWLVAKPREAAKRIRNHLHLPRWEEPILLAIGFYGMEFPDDVSELVEQAILGNDLGGPSPYEDVLHRDLLFALRVLGDQDVNVMLCAKIVDRSFKLWKDIYASRYRTLTSRFKSILQALEDSIAGNNLDSEFLAALHDKDRNVHTRAVDALANATAQPEVVLALLAALRDGNYFVRANAAGALANATAHPEVVSALLAALRDGDYFVRANAAGALANATAHPEVVSALLAALRDEEKPVRANAAGALANATASPQVVLALLAALRDRNKRVRERAAGALANATGQPEVVLALLAALRDNDGHVRANAVSLLANATGQPEVVAGLRVALRDEDKSARASAADALANATGQPEVVLALLAALRDEEKPVRANAAGALANATAQPEVVSALLAALRDGDYFVRANAAGALANATGQPEVVLALLAALRDDDGRVRAKAVSLLANATGQPEVVAGLRVALRDEDKSARASAADALANATAQPEVVLALLAALRDEDGRVRANAAGALANATAQPEVVSALLAAVRDEDGRVRASAADALANITGQPEVVAGLLAALRDEDGRVRTNAAGALASAAAQPEVGAALLLALRDKDKIVRTNAADSLANATGQPEVIVGLLAALRDEDGSVRSHAASSIQEIVRQTTTKFSVELPEQICSSLKLPGLDENTLEWAKNRDSVIYTYAYDSLFDALMAVAPRAKV